MKHPFQAVAVRYVHDVLTGEFLNIGVVLLCPAGRFAGARFVSEWSRVTRTFPNADLAHLRRLASAISTACESLYPRQGEARPPAASEDILAFLSRVIPLDDSSLQFSGVIRGISDEPVRTLAELTTRYAERYLPQPSEDVVQVNADARESVARSLARLEELGREAASMMLLGHTSDEGFDASADACALNVAPLRSLGLVQPRPAKWTAVSQGRVKVLQSVQQGEKVVYFYAMEEPNPPGHAWPATRHFLGFARPGPIAERDVNPEEWADQLIEHKVRLHTF